MITTGYTQGMTARLYPVVVDKAGGPFRLYEQTPAHAREREISVRVSMALAAAGERAALETGGLVRITDENARGTAGDLATAIAALGVNNTRTRSTVFFGELALDGTLRSPRGLLALVHEADARGFQRVVLPAGDLRLAQQAAASVYGVHVLVAATLADVCAWVREADCLTTVGPVRYSAPASVLDPVQGPAAAILEDLQACVRAHTGPRALRILLVGPPGSGKTMIARRLVSALPALEAEELDEVNRIYDAAGLPMAGCRPFRAPHHTASTAALDGGRQGGVGEITLAAHGVLFLDELPEFRTDALRLLHHDALHTANGVGKVRVLVAAANPCPCGYANGGAPNPLNGRPSRVQRECRCPVAAVSRYRERAFKLPWDLVIEGSRTSFDTREVRS